MTSDFNLTATSNTEGTITNARVDYCPRCCTCTLTATMCTCVCKGGHTKYAGKPPRLFSEPIPKKTWPKPKVRR